MNITNKSILPSDSDDEELTYDFLDEWKIKNQSDFIINFINKNTAFNPDDYDEDDVIPLHFVEQAVVHFDSSSCAFKKEDCIEIHKKVEKEMGDNEDEDLNVISFDEFIIDAAVRNIYHNVTNSVIKYDAKKVENKQTYLIKLIVEGYLKTNQIALTITIPKHVYGIIIKYSKIF